MNTTKNIYFLFIVLALPLFTFNASAAQAAEIYFAPHTETIYAGDVFILEARISSPDELINVADGAFLFDTDDVEVTELSVGGSVFSLWAHEPSFSNTDGRVSFVGGVPDGFQDTDGLIVKAIFRAKRAGETTLFFESGFSLFRGDGNGTNFQPQTRPLSLTIAERPAQTSPKDEWRELIGADTVPPTFVEAVVSRDERYFNNKYFVSFFATDAASGVAYYEIKEGDRDFVRAVSPYALQDQALEGSIQLRAIDSAGNESVTTPESVSAPRAPSREGTVLWAVLVLVLVAAAVFFRTRRTHQHEN